MNASMSYSQDQFDADVLFFNRAAGRVLPQTQEEFDREVMQQQRLVQEECVETQIALIEEDAVEVLDGLTDILYTASYLAYILTGCKDSGFQVSNLLSVWLDTLPVNQVGQLFEEAVVLEAMQRVALNNNSKFTADKEQAERWAAAMPELTLKEAVVDGVVYWCLVDANQKVKKHCDYQPVDLSDLVADYVVEDLGLVE